MLSVIFAKCGKIGLYAECRYAKCHYAERRYAECRYAECHYAECHYAECRYAERRGTDLIAKFSSNCVLDCQIE